MANFGRTLKIIALLSFVASSDFCILCPDF